MKSVGHKLICGCHKEERFIVKKHPRLGLLCREGNEAFKAKEEKTVRLVSEFALLTVEHIRKVSNLSTPALKNKAIRIFNAWIRKRDAGKPCISCGNPKTLQAGHFYSAGKFTHMRFNEDNVHGQCLKCNYYEQQSDTYYRHNLIMKIGRERVERLDLLASIKTPQKDNRFFYIEIIEKYSPQL